MKFTKVQIIISSIVLIGFLIGLYLMRKDTEFESRHAKGILRDLYKDSLKNEIIEVDYYLRSDHIIIDNHYEYFMTNKSVSGDKKLRGVLMDWVRPGDSIFKKADTNWFTIIKSDGERLIINFE